MVTTDNDTTENNGQDRQIRISKQRILLASTILLVILGIIGVLAYSPAATTISTPSPLLGKVAPNIAGNSITNGSYVSLQNYRGKFVILNFFASWCTPCFDESPALITFAYNHRKTNNVAILGIVFSDTSSRASNFLKSVGATWNAINDQSGSIAIKYGVSEPPETFLISPSGIVLAKFIGPVTLAGLNEAIGRYQ